jgi:hypothetical protein
MLNERDLEIWVTELESKRKLCLAAENGKTNDPQDSRIASCVIHGRPVKDGCA